jgi:hypothetical protein
MLKFPIMKRQVRIAQKTRFAMSTIAAKAYALGNSISKPC